MSAEAPLSELRCARCRQPARLQCPRCVELHLERDLASFCSQDCFKASSAAQRYAWLSPLSSAAARGGGKRGRPQRGLMACTCCRPQADWVEHKKLHKPSLEGWHYCTRRGQDRSLAMPEFQWTGPLRPHRIGPMREVRGQRPRHVCRV